MVVRRTQHPPPLPAVVLVVVAAAAAVTPPPLPVQTPAHNWADAPEFVPRNISQYQEALPKQCEYMPGALGSAIVCIP